MNRHARRRARKLAGDQWLSKMQLLQDAARVSGTTWALQLNFYLLHQITSDPDVLPAFVHWSSHIPVNKPLCLTCSREWSTWSDGIHRPPAGIVILQPWNHNNSEVRIICAVCSACIQHSDVGEKIRHSVRKLAPHAQFHDVRVGQ